MMHHKIVHQHYRTDEAAQIIRKVLDLEEKSIHHSSESESELLPEGVDTQTLDDLKKGALTGVKNTMMKAKKARIAERKHIVAVAKQQVTGIYNVRAIDRFTKNNQDEWDKRPPT